MLRLRARGLRRLRPREGWGRALSANEWRGLLVLVLLVLRDSRLGRDWAGGGATGRWASRGQNCRS